MDDKIEGVRHLRAELPSFSYVAQFPGPVGTSIDLLPKYPPHPILVRKLSITVSTKGLSTTYAVLRKNGQWVGCLALPGYSVIASAVISVEYGIEDALTLDVEYGSGFDMCIRVDYEAKL